jgi:hypothetical protein
MEYQDLNLRPSSDDTPPSDDTPYIVPVVDDQQPQWPKMVAAGVLVIAVAVTGYLVFRNRPTTPAASDAAKPATAPSEPAAPLGADVPPIDLPPLDESDDVVRGLVRELSSNPAVAAWLATDNLIRNFTVVVSNIASGEPAAGLVKALRPVGPFQVEEHGEDLFINSRSYARYLPLATATTSIEPQAAARLYAQLKPRIEDAYKELGHPDTPFDQTLERAIVVLLKTPLPEGRVEVQPGGAVVYRFADPALERLTPSQKLLIRFGPDNQRAVQTSLRNIALALGIPDERLP